MTGPLVLMVGVVGKGLTVITTSSDKSFDLQTGLIVLFVKVDTALTLIFITSFSVFLEEPETSIWLPVLLK